MVKEIVFLGHIVSSAGLKLDLSKVEAISKMNTSTNKDDIDHLRGWPLSNKIVQIVLVPVNLTKFSLYSDVNKIQGHSLLIIISDLAIF